jgi:transposase InsO family protein
MRRSENEFELKLKKVRSDNGSEFKNTSVEEFCDEKGIKHEFSTTYTPEQNGVVERKNRTLIEMARSMLDEYKVLDSFWAEAINTACHASNRLYCHRFFNKTPYELLNGRKPNISYFQVFGCKCYILRKGSRLSKFQSKCDEGFFLDILQIPKHIEYTTSLRDLLRKHMMCNSMKQWALKMRKRI